MKNLAILGVAVLSLSGCSTIKQTATLVGTGVGIVASRAAHVAIVPVVIVGAVAGAIVGDSLEQKLRKKQEELAQLRAAAAGARYRNRRQNEQIENLESEVADLEHKIHTRKQTRTQ